MRVCWYGDHRLGLVRDGAVHDASAALDHLPPLPYPWPKGDPLITHLDKLRPHIEEAADQGAGTDAAEVRFLSPVQAPTKIIGVPVNYQKHIDEAIADDEITTERVIRHTMDQGLFLKANSALVGPGEGVRRRFADLRTDHEMELGIVIGRQAANVSEKDALDHVAGYAIALDMVVRGPEDRSLRKSVDSYAVLGPWLVTADEIADPDRLDLSLAIGGETRQDSNTANMIVNCRQIIAWASRWYTLWPGDIIMTGTPEGVGPVKPGDVMHCEIDGIGAMDVPVGGE